MEQVLYADARFKPSAWPSRGVWAHQVIPAVMHRYGSEFSGCPCGCANQGMQEERLTRIGALTVLQDKEDGSRRLLAPGEVSRAMGWPHWIPTQHSIKGYEGAGQRIWLSLLGNCIAPAHAIHVVGTALAAAGDSGIAARVKAAHEALDLDVRSPSQGELWSTEETPSDEATVWVQDCRKGYWLKVKLDAPREPRLGKGGHRNGVSGGGLS